MHVCVTLDEDHTYGYRVTSQTGFFYEFQKTHFFPKNNFFFKKSKIGNFGIIIKHTELKMPISWYRKIISSGHL